MTCCVGSKVHVCTDTLCASALVFPFLPQLLIKLLLMEGNQHRGSFHSQLGARQTHRFPSQTPPSRLAAPGLGWHSQALLQHSGCIYREFSSSLAALDRSLARSLYYTLSRRSVLRDVIMQFCNLIGLQDSCSRVQIAVKLDARPSRFALVGVAPPDYALTRVGEGQMRAGRLRFKLHSSSYIPHTSCIYVDCHTLEAGELSFGLGSEPIRYTVGVSSRRKPRYHIPPA